MAIVQDKDRDINKRKLHVVQVKGSLNENGASVVNKNVKKDKWNETESKMYEVCEKIMFEHRALVA